MRFDVTHRGAGRLRQSVQGADLIYHVGKQIVGRDVDEAPAEAGQVAIAHLRADAHAPLGGQPAHRQQPGRIARMKSARNVGAGDDAEHGVVITEMPDAEAFTQVGVEVDAGHGR
jgi:hypothetical protein